MRCTKHVFDLKVLLFIFLVESDPNFCGSGRWTGGGAGLFRLTEDTADM